MRTVRRCAPPPRDSLHRVKLAVIGTGVSGLGAAHVLARVHDVDVFEREARPGGHAHTITVPQDDGPSLALDTGFLVHNTANYPLLTRLFDELGVATRRSEMSFSVTCRRCALSYAGRDLWGQRRHILRPRMLRLLAEITRFAWASRQWSDGRHRTRTLAQLVVDEGFSREFQDHFLVPFTAAIWSMGPGEVLSFPADDALAFFANHQLLGLARHQWRTVVGGSQRYVQAVLAPLGNRVHLSAPVRSITRHADGVDLVTMNGDARHYDAVIIATHSDQALSLLANPTDQERAILGQITYTPNHSVLHTDTSLLPDDPSTYAAWNYIIDDCRDMAAPASVTYLLNRLQGITTEAQYCVTLNRTDIARDSIIAEIPVSHPRYSFAAIRAQAQLPAINGVDRIWFAGAYHGHGFHEDGLRSGITVARAIGVDW